MSNTTEPRPDLNLEQQRKRAKELRRAHRAASADAALRIARHLPRARGKDPSQILEAPLTLSDAQLVIARETGFASWPDLRRHLWAIERGRDESARVLAEGEVAVDNLFFAAGLNRIDVLTALLASGAHINTRHWSGLTALHAAASMGHEEATTFLLEYGADPALRQTRWNSTAAGMARWLKHERIAQLIERGG